MRKITVAIDGFSGCGKSSTAKEVAKKLNYIYVDTGAMYRAITLYFVRQTVDIKSLPAVEKALNEVTLSFKGEGIPEIHLNGENVESFIRSMDISNQVSAVSAIGLVRDFLVAQQREMGNAKGLVMDGRDIGTTVFPDAELKIFMTADTVVRAKRRLKELEGKGEVPALEDVVKNLEERDHLDSTREESPLKKADGAIEIDTTHLSFEEQVTEIVVKAEKLFSYA